MPGSLGLPRLPSESPKWLTARRAAVAALAWPPVALGLLVAVIDRPWSYAPVTTLVVIAVAIVAQVLVARSIAQRSSRAIASALAMGSQPVIASACFLVLCFAWGTTVHSHAGTLIMGIQGFAAGILPGVWQGALASSVVGHLRARSHEMRDRMLVHLGLGLALPGAILGITWSEATSLKTWQAVAWGIATVLAPLLLVTWACVRMRARRRWLRAVEREQVPGWRIIDQPLGASGGVVPILTPRLTTTSTAVHVRVLVHADPARAPFRDVDTIEPFALVVENGRLRPD